MALGRLLAVALFLIHLTSAVIVQNFTTHSECKTCPYSLCTNKAVYEWGYPWYDHPLNATLTCWTEGETIGDDNVWLRTTEGCYVTQFDLDEYPGDYTVDLPYCGRIPPHWTTGGRARTRYKTECWTTPNPQEWHGKMYKENVDLELTCVSPHKYDILANYTGQRTWYRTKSNCYVHEGTLWRPVQADDLDDCGPTLETWDPSDHAKPRTTTTTSSPTPTPSPISLKPANSTSPPRFAQTTGPIPSSLVEAPHGSVRLLPKHDVARSPAPRLRPRFLYHDTIADEGQNCTEKWGPDRGRIVRTYRENQTVQMQCGAVVQSPYDIFLLTVDWCYIRNDDLWHGVYEDGIAYRYLSLCEEFTDTVT